MDHEPVTRRDGNNNTDITPWIQEMDSLDPRLRAEQAQAQAAPAATTSYPSPLQAANRAHQTDTGSNTLSPGQYPPHPDAHQPPYSQHTSYDPINDVNTASHGTPDSGGQEAGQDGQKRPRACEACRGLKVRCEFDGSIPDGPCKRCARAHRNCVITQPSRKRQKKTDGRVAELEKKIDALTASLNASKTTPPSYGPGTGSRQPAGQGSSAYTSHAIFDPQHDTRLLSGDWERPPPRPAEVAPMISQSSTTMSGQKRRNEDGPVTYAFGSTSKPATSEALDTSEDPKLRQSSDREVATILVKNAISPQAAETMFRRYTEQMAPLMPAVVFPPDITWSDASRAKPVLFLAILSAASGSVDPELQKAITKDLMQLYATRIMINGEKTLELIQALLVSTIWYYPPEHFEELKFYQFIHTAAIMAIDINISRKNKDPKARVNSSGFFAGTFGRQNTHPDPESIEARRAWMGCYYLCCNAAMGLRRQNLVRWSPYLEDCLQVLETTPGAPTDIVWCQWIRSQHIAEEVGYSFSMDDPFAIVSISDLKVAHALKGFERDIEMWSQRTPKECRSSLLDMTEHVLGLYTHEIAMHVDHNVEEFQAPFSEESLTAKGVAKDATAPLSPLHISALSTCVSSIDGIFTSFLAMDIEMVRLLPIIHFVRIAYATVALIKLYFAAANESSELSRVIEKDTIRVDHYLDRLIHHFRAAAVNDRCRPASKVLTVLVMLKAWFHRLSSGKKDARKADRGSAGAQIEQPTAMKEQGRSVQHTEYGPANTPLQLLSEVATGGQPHTHPAPRRPSQTQTSQTPYQNQQQAYPGSWLNQHAPPPNYDDTTFNMPGNIDPSLDVMSGFGMDFAASSGAGFEQAMGLTMGEGGFDYQFNDDMFFDAIMGGGFGGGGGM